MRLLRTRVVLLVAYKIRLELNTCFTSRTQTNAVFRTNNKPNRDRNWERVVFFFIIIRICRLVDFVVFTWYPTITNT